MKDEQFVGAVIGAIIALIVLWVASAHASTYRLTSEELKGGDVYAFRRDFSLLAARGHKVVISGKCLSACTIGLKHRNVCVTPGSILGFHAAKNWENEDINPRGTAVLLSAIPPELIGRQVKLPLTTRYQYVLATELPKRYLCH